MKKDLLSKDRIFLNWRASCSRLKFREAAVKRSKVKKQIDLVRSCYQCLYRYTQSASLIKQRLRSLNCFLERRNLYLVYLRWTKRTLENRYISIMLNAICSRWRYAHLQVAFSHLRASNFKQTINNQESVSRIHISRLETQVVDSRREISLLHLCGVLGHKVERMKRRALQCMLACSNRGRAIFDWERRYMIKSKVQIISSTWQKWMHYNALRKKVKHMLSILGKYFLRLSIGVWRRDAHLGYVRELHDMNVSLQNDLKSKEISTLSIMKEKSDMSLKLTSQEVRLDKTVDVICSLVKRKDKNRLTSHIFSIWALYFSKNKIRDRKVEAMRIRIAYTNTLVASMNVWRRYALFNQRRRRAVHVLYQRGLRRDTMHCFCVWRECMLAVRSESINELETSRQVSLAKNALNKSLKYKVIIYIHTYIYLYIIIIIV
jgi:hypothetical protein